MSSGCAMGVQGAECVQCVVGVCVCVCIMGVTCVVGVQWVCRELSVCTACWEGVSVCVTCVTCVMGVQWV